MVEVRDLLAKDEVLEQGRPTQPGLERVLVVADGHALVGRQRAVGRIDAHAIERTGRRVLADVRTAAADLVGAVHLGDGTRADDRIGGFDRAPSRWRQRRVRIVFGCLVRIEWKRGRQS